MHYQHNHRLFFGFAAIIIISGCAPLERKPIPLYPGKESAAEALSILKSRSEGTVPIKANGRCHLLYYIEEKRHKEHFSVKIWAAPPAEIYLQGDVAFDPRGVILGSNENEFWLAVRLKEISSYWRGGWRDISHIDELMISPRLVLEAFGIAAVDSNENSYKSWTLSKKEAFDVLARHDGKGGIIKKIYIYNCDYSVQRIEYFDVNGRVKVIVELDKYEQISDGFFVPMFIKITRHGESVRDLDSVTIKLTSVKPDSFNEKKRNLLFRPPQADGFKYVFINVNGKWIEQKQD